MKRYSPLLVAAAIAFLPVAASPSDDESGIAQLESQLRAVETAFAKSMAERDLNAFKQFLASEAIFFGDSSVHRGREAIAEAWAPFFEGDDAPFSWKPESVGVLDSGTLGVTSGPVFDPSGARIGTFNSVWQRTGETWQIIFDRGCPPCDCP